MPCVLIVEDDDEVRPMLDVMLTIEGYQTMVAANGQEALEQLAVRRPSLILLDIEMPVMDGYEFRAIQLQDPRLAEIPVICLTAGERIDVIERQTGMPCLSKPATVAALLAAIRNVCGSP
jgi:Response regulators consisting of a CheY-like receiver domain and a winged-helix DNA-binding domain